MIRTTLLGLLWLGWMALPLRAQIEADPPPSDPGLRAFLGISSIPVYFMPTGPAGGCYLAVLEFKKGRKVWESPGITGYFQRFKKPTPQGKEELIIEPFQAELVFGRREGHVSGCIVSNDGSVTIAPFPGLDNLQAITGYEANGHPPTEKMDGWLILSYCVGRGDADCVVKAGGDAARIAATASDCVIFAMKDFPTEREALLYRVARQKAEAADAEPGIIRAPAPPAD
jgi:hypothetical protein